MKGTVKKMKIVKRALKICAVILSAVLLLALLQEYIFYFDGYNAWRIRGFYKEEKNSLNAVFIGSSDFTTGFAPGIAYEKFGFTSYPVATDSATVKLWKSEIKEIRKHQSPDVIVVELNGALYDDEAVVNDSNSARWYFDAVPLSVDKTVSVAEQQFGEEDKNNLVNMLFPMIKYHVKIAEAGKMIRTKLAFQSMSNMKLRGFMTTPKQDQPKPLLSYEQGKTIPLTESSEKYLRDFLSYCKSKNIDNLLFVRFPHRIASEFAVNRVYRCNEAARIISEYGYDFVDYEQNNLMGIDFDTDFYNDDHVNVYGARKITETFGAYLQKRYHLTQRSLPEKVTISWEETAQLTEKLFGYAEKIMGSGKAIFEMPGERVIIE